MCVTGTPDGFFTPLDAQPATSAAIVAPQTEMDILASDRFMILQIEMLTARESPIQRFRAEQLRRRACQRTRR
jgi:hypothetical protein